jgi:tRNA(Arg) A34 adenosine deaminase TadA
MFNLLQAEQLNHQVEVEGGVLGGFCGELLQESFRLRRVGDGVPNPPARGR